MRSKEIVHTQNPKVACDGGTGASGHPIVYLQIDPKIAEAVCPYCSKKFILTK